MKAADIIEQLGLVAHPEGGWYREIYRSDQIVPTDRGDRSAGTGIYYLLEAGDFSAFHRVLADEVWHAYVGGRATLVQLTDKGIETTLLGTDLTDSQIPQALVPAGVWQGVYLNEGTEFALMGCTVSPGFDFDDFELAERSELMAQFPDAPDLIEQLTRL